VEKHGTKLPGQGINARDYAVVGRAKFNREIAVLVQEYLSDR
jgi:hypothetical protein